jgi:hypothetical protein
MHRPKRPNAATIAVAVLAALAVATGSATAASLITGKQIKNNSVTGKDIKNRSIKLKDIGFYNGDGAGDIFTVTREMTLAPSGDVGDNGFVARCPRGTRVVGTGYSGFGVALVQSYGTFVGAYMYNLSDTESERVSVQAICTYGWRGNASAAIAGAQGSYTHDLATARKRHQR